MPNIPHLGNMPCMMLGSLSLTLGSSKIQGIIPDYAFFGNGRGLPGPGWKPQFRVKGLGFRIQSLGFRV